MILCVTLNPCLDKTLVVPPWSPGDSVRGQSVSEVVGGKGNNVARALTRLGRTARPATLLGGPVGDRCETLLREVEGLDPVLVRTGGPTRTILTVRTIDSHRQTAFFDPDPAITSQEAEAFFREVETILLKDDVEALTLSGSSPSEATHGLYFDMISTARTRQIPVFLDTYGPPLRTIWGFWPDVIQLNRSEAAEHLRLEDPEDHEVFGLLSTWHRHGVKLGIVTDGPDAALIQVDGRFYRAYPPEIDPVNPVGSGDCLLAGLVDAWLNRSEVEETLRHALACSVANALTWSAGEIDRPKLDTIKSEIELEPLEQDPTDPAPDTKPSKAFIRVGVYGRTRNRFGRK